MWNLNLFFQLSITDDLKKAADRVVQVAKANKSTDNISVLLILLKDPHKIAEQAQHIQVYSVNMDSRCVFDILQIFW